MLRGRLLTLRIAFCALAIFFYSCSATVGAKQDTNIRERITQSFAKIDSLTHELMNISEQKAYYYQLKRQDVVNNIGIHGLELLRDNKDIEKEYLCSFSNDTLHKPIGEDIDKANKVIMHIWAHGDAASLAFDEDVTINVDGGSTDLSHNDTMYIECGVHSITLDRGLQFSDRKKVNIEKGKDSRIEFQLFNINSKHWRKIFKKNNNYGNIKDVIRLGSNICLLRMYHIDRGHREPEYDLVRNGSKYGYPYYEKVQKVPGYDYVYAYVWFKYYKRENGDWKRYRDESYMKGSDWDCFKLTEIYDYETKNIIYRRNTEEYDEDGEGDDYHFDNIIDWNKLSP